KEHVLEIADVVHAAGGLLYYDGANFNAILGRTSPGKMNFDIVHFNLHKTFTTPHGGGGPGAGPVGVKKALEPFLPVPLVSLNGRGYHLDYDRPKSIGKVRAWYGNFALLVRAYAYILRMGGDGLREVSDRAVLNANYVRHRLQGVLDVPFGGLRKHEVVALQIPDQYVGPVEFALLRPEVCVFRTRVFEVESDQVDAGRPKLVREEDGPVAIREAAEIAEPSGGPRLGGGYRLAREERSPLADR